MKDLEVRLYSDADFAGDNATSRSTSGVFLALWGRHTSFPLSGQSKKQTCVSHSTPEAELVAADLAVRTEGLPAFQLWETVLGRKLHIDFREDNAAAIQIMKTGKNPTIRHMGRTHRVDLAWLHERVVSGEIVLTCCQSCDMAADISTKPFTNRDKWLEVCRLINHMGVARKGPTNKPRTSRCDRPTETVPAVGNDVDHDCDSKPTMPISEVGNDMNHDSSSETVVTACKTDSDVNHDRNSKPTMPREAVGDDMAHDSSCQGARSMPAVGNDMGHSSGKQGRPGSLVGNDTASERTLVEF